jgi:hypothetical protein
MGMKIEMGNGVSEGTMYNNTRRRDPFSSN